MAELKTGPFLNRVKIVIRNMDTKTGALDAMVSKTKLAMEDDGESLEASN